MADDLATLLTLERVDRDLFRGRNANYGPRQSLFGGQVAAQSLLAAAATVEPDRLPHSFHGYFLRAGRVDLPIIFEVDRDRDGRSFSARHVVAVQDGDVIFSMITSFHVESGGSVFDEAPRREAPDPELVPHKAWSTLLEVREVTPTDFLKGVFSDSLWVRSSTKLGDDPLLHRAGLTFLSDLGTGFGQQDRSVVGRGGPSIDHAMWFQEDIRADDWVLVDLRPVKARSARGHTTDHCGIVTAGSGPPSTRSSSSCPGRRPTCSGTRPRCSTRPGVTRSAWSTPRRGTRRRTSTRRAADRRHLHGSRSG